MSQQEESFVKVHLFHQLIGTQSFDLNLKDNIVELRNYVCESTPLCIYENFHFEHEGKPLPEYNEIGDKFKSDIRLSIVLDEFDNHSSRYHHNKICDMLHDPYLWAIAWAPLHLERNSAQHQIKSITSLDLEQMLKDPFSSKLLEPRHKQGEIDEFCGMLNPSGYNPPPYYRRLMGDFYYISIKTLEDCDYHVTANPEGFFVNCSTSSHFNPTSNSKYAVCNSLFELLNQLSPRFRTRFKEVIDGIKINDFQKMLMSSLCPTQSREWLRRTCTRVHLWRNESLETKEKKYDFSTIKDWNEIFQIQKVLPTDSLYDKIGKEKLKFKVYYQFTNCAKEGAIAILNGSLTPLNNCHRLQERIYFYCSLFFSFASPSATDKKGNTPKVMSEKQANIELRNIEELQVLQGDGFCLSHMVIVKYRGYKIIAQTFPPSLLYQQSLKSNCNMKELFTKHNKIQTDSELAKVLLKICKMLHIKHQQLILEPDGRATKIIGVPDIKGIVCSDERRYIADLLQLSLRDMNYTGTEHQECFLRTELVKLYTQRQKGMIPFNTLIGTGYSVVASERAKQEEKQLKDLSKFAKDVMVPLCLDSFQAEMRRYLSDTRGVMKVLHRHGLSSKYLGVIYSRVDAKQSPHIRVIIERVILVKSLKNVCRTAMRQATQQTLRAVLVNLLNCIFCGSLVTDHDDEHEEEVDSGSRRRKRKGKDREDNLQINLQPRMSAYLQIRPGELWKMIKKVAQAKFSYSFGDQRGASQLFMHRFSREATLRDLCLNLGLVLQRQPYFDRLFRDTDIVAIEPICKLPQSEAKDLLTMIEEGDKMVSKFFVEEAIEAYNRAAQYIVTSYGGAHEKLASINKKMASIYFKIGDIDASIMFAEHSCEMYKAIYGHDHVEAIDNYLLLGLFHFARREYAAAEYYILDAIFVATVTYSECYPELLLLYLNLSTVYEAQHKYTDALFCLFRALDISLNVFGENHLHTAIILSALATSHYEIPDIAQSIKYQTRCLAIMEYVLPIEDNRVQQAKNTLQNYRSLQYSKRIKDMHEKEQKYSLNSQMFGRMPLFKMPEMHLREKPESLWRQRGRKIRYCA